MLKRTRPGVATSADTPSSGANSPSATSASAASLGDGVAPRAMRFSPRARLILLGVITVVVILAYMFLLIRGAWSFTLPRRATILATMLVAAFTQGTATVLFHTITHNRILTPSIIGFDSLYVLMQTVMVFVFGGTVIAKTEGIPKLLAQTLLMVAFATILYRWLFTSKYNSLYFLLLIGVVLGMAFDSISSFLQRLLSPTEFDVLSVELFGRMSDVDRSYLPLAYAVCAVVAIIVWRRRHTLDVLLLGRENATNLGVNHQREVTLNLIIIAVLVAFSTALAGPLTFFGFIIATLAYQFAGTHRHAYVIPMSIMLGVITLVGGQFIIQHIFYASGMLTVLIEFVGGALFLAVLLRKGTL